MAEKFYATIDDIAFPHKDYVLVIPGWYPTSFDPFTGDFVQRQVIAAGLYTPQVVLYIVKDQTRKLSTTTCTINKPSENVLEVRVTYPQRKNKYVDLIYSNSNFLTLLFKYSQLIKNKLGMPILLHAYVVVRGGLGAWPTI